MSDKPVPLTKEGLDKIQHELDQLMTVRRPEIARRIVPGQFVMLRLAKCSDPLLGRPLALYDVDLLGAAEKPRWTWDAKALTVELPAPPPGEHAFMFRIATRP